MKLLFAIKTMHLAGGGVERLLVQLMSGLLDKGHEIFLVTCDAAETPAFYRYDPRVRTSWLNCGGARRKSGFLETIIRTARLRKALRQVRPDIAVGFMHSAYVPLAFAAVGTGIPALGSEHIVWRHYSDRPLERLALLTSAPFLKRVSAVSEQALVSFPALLRRKMVAIPNAVVSAQGRVANVIGPPEKVLLSVGRLEPQKDHETLIRAFAAIAPNFADWTLRIVGEGSLRQPLEALTRQLGIERRVRLPGATADVESEYLGAQLFAIASRYESFGLVTAEALAHGIPVVGFADCPGTNELVSDGENGLLVGGSDRVAALSQGLSQLMESEQERLRMAAVAPAAVSDYSVDAMVARWERLLLEVAAEAAAQRAATRGAPTTSA